MELDIKKQKLNLSECQFQQKSEQTVDLEINLPDYCSDIKRILKCFVTPGLSSVQTAGDRITAKGDVLVRLLYVDENEKIDCYEQSAALNVFCQTKDMPENPCISAFAETQYVNCRALSQRRFSVNASVCVNFSLWSRNQKEIVRSCGNDMIQTKGGSISAIESSIVGEKTFDLSETVALEENKKAVGKILRSDGNITVETSKSVNGKILVKGNMSVNILYCADSKEGDFVHLLHTMPISQIVEISEINDKYKISLEPKIHSLIVNTKTDSSGKNRFLEITARASVFVSATKEKSIKYVTDCYCTDYEGEFAYDNFEFSAVECLEKKKKAVSSSVDLSGQNVKEIIDVRPLSCSYASKTEEKKAIITATVVFSLLFADSKGKYQYSERSVDFSLDCEMKNACSKIKPNISFVFENISATPSGDKVNLSFNASAEIEIFSLNQIRLLKSLKVDENAPKEANEAAIIVYYCSKGESYWEIAKRYNTAEKKIQEENETEGELADKERMLLIPCV